MAELGEVPLIRLLDCGVCYQPFDLMLHKPMLTSCGHSLCKECRNILIAGTKFPCCEQETLEGDCDNCRKIACPFCRHPRALQIPMNDYAFLENLDGLREKLKAQDRNTQMAAIRLEQEKRKLQAKKEQLAKILQKNKEMEKEKQRLLEKRGAKCSSCQDIGLSDRDLRLCIECTDKNFLHRSAYRVLLTDWQKGREVAVCSYCYLHSKHIDHKHLSLLQLMRLAQVEERIEELKGTVKDHGIERKEQELQGLRKKYMEEGSVEEQKKILAEVEALMRRL